MTFRNQTNVSRIHKINDMLALLQKSADSNKTSADEVWEVMQPVIDSISELCSVESERPPTLGGDTVKSSVNTTKPPLWASIREMAETVPLKDLTVAMAVYLNRLDEELNQ